MDISEGGQACNGKIVCCREFIRASGGFYVVTDVGYGFDVLEKAAVEAGHVFAHFLILISRRG